MWVELDFGSEQTVDGVRMESPLDCTLRVVRLEAAGEAGEWQTVSAGARIDAVESSSFMGKAAMRELKARGFDYLFVRNSEPGWAEILENPEAWGLTALGDAGNGRLYRNDAGYPILMDQNKNGKIVSRR
jgi:hypothetical protein